MQTLIGKSLDELKEVTQKLSFPKFAAKQMADWLYKKNINSIDDMSNLSVKQREQLKAAYTLGKEAPVKQQVSADGTKKYLFKITENRFIEAAYIPESDRATLCVSSQVGCKFGCKFCMTGKQGFQQNLGAAQILNQIISLPERNKLTNIVFMGMGEPLDNLKEVMKSTEIMTAEYGFAWSPKRITVSTTGILPELAHFLEHGKCRLALSVHNPFDEERIKIMPVQKANPLSKITELLKKYDFNRQRRFSVEYIMFKNFNDQKKHADKLAELMHGIEGRINLIRYHNLPGSRLQGSDYTTMEQFQNRLKSKNIITTIRKSRGQDIDAACGLLSTKELVSTYKS